MPKMREKFMPEKKAVKAKKTPQMIEAKFTKPLVDAFLANALPGENEGFDRKASEEAVQFILSCVGIRKKGAIAIAAESFTDGRGRLASRIAICNDDMPFLVDSVSGIFAQESLVVRRLIHPVVYVERDTAGAIIAISERSQDASQAIGMDREPAKGRRESFIYLETDRIAGVQRRRLESTLKDVLVEVRCAVEDWPKMLLELDGDAAALDAGSEGAELIRWFQNGSMTIVGHETLGRDGNRTRRLGLSRATQQPILSDASIELAFKWFDKGGRPPLLLKANRLSRVHRNVLLDLMIVPVRDGKKVGALSLTAGLWTSEALASKPENIPVLRQYMSTLMDKFGFDPAGHAGKAMAHVLTSLPHDILVSLDINDLERVALTAMSLNDRPRPKLLAVRSPLGRHLFVIVWLPRDDVSTSMRNAIADMLIAGANANLLGWSISLEDSGVAMLRFTLDLPNRSAKVNEAALDRKLQLMVRGWEPAVEAALTKTLDAKRAAAVMLRYAAAFPSNYRTSHTVQDAADDMLGLLVMERDKSRVSRLYPKTLPDELGLKVYNKGGAMPLSDIVPVLENFGFTVLEESPTPLAGGQLAYIHDFRLQPRAGANARKLIDIASVIETALSQVLNSEAENDAFNQLIPLAAIAPNGVIWLRAYYRYLRQAGYNYGLLTVVAALTKNAHVTKSIIALFSARHDPSLRIDREAETARLVKAIDRDLIAISAIEEDRILRLYRAVVLATLRTNAYGSATSEALAFKLDSAKVPGLPAPLPWREIWVYSPRVEGIHLRAGPVARGGLRWSDRRDDFRTEVLGLMKAQRVKNAVIVPTGAKGGFFPKRLPDPRADREAWIAEGTESYRIFIRTLLSVTDNLVNNTVAHPGQMIIHDGSDPYFVVAADKGTATFSDTANAIAIEHGFWLGDAFASGGSVGYDHKAMGITAKGGWISVQRHFLEMGIDVQKDPVTVAGVGDMSGDVFGNGMLLSKSIKLVAAFDHRHIFIDPDPDPAKSWKERKRMFGLPRSSWADYNPDLISKGGGLFARTEKSVKLTPEMRKLLDVTEAEMEPAQLMQAILKSQAQLLWFGGIGTYIKNDSENHIEVGDPGNDAIRVSASELRAKVIGEGANLGTTQAGRIGFALRGGRINTDFIDNSAGVDCSDNEVNIKIALNAKMASGQLTYEARNSLLARMTGAVADLVLEDNRLQTLALSVAEMGGAGDVPAYIRLIETFEASGKLVRAVEGIGPNDELHRRVQDHRGLVRPELSVLLSTAKLAAQEAIEHAPFAADVDMAGELLAAFPSDMVAAHKDAILSHRLRKEIIATKLANRMVNRLGMLHPFELMEEEGCGLAEVASAFHIAEEVFGARALWESVDGAKIGETSRLILLSQIAIEMRAHMADIIRNSVQGRNMETTIALYRDVVGQLSDARESLLPDDVKQQTEAFHARLITQGAPKKIADAIVRIAQLDGAIGLAALANAQKHDVHALTRAFTAIGDALGIGWAQGVAMQLDPNDPWERLLAAGLARDFQAMRLDFLRRRSAKKPADDTAKWLADNEARVATFKAMVDRARSGAMPTPAMLAQIAGQARVLLGK
jgi:glutamate dehydrogenase